MSVQKSRLVVIGDRVSDGVSKLFAHPYMQIGVILFCAAWFLFGFHADLLTATLSILAITLTQMVLNRQNDREVDAHRRDVAMHAKLDELLHAMRGARDEMAGIETMDEEDIEHLREKAKLAIESKGQRAGDRQERAVSKQAVDEAADTAGHGVQVAERKKRYRR